MSTAAAKPAASDTASPQSRVPSWPTTATTRPAVSTAAASASLRLIVAATVYRAIASATGNSAPCVGHTARTAAASRVQPNTGPGQTRRSGSARTVRAATARLAATGSDAGWAVWPNEKCARDAAKAIAAQPMSKAQERRRPRSRVFDRLPEGHTCILAPGAVHASRRRSCQAARPASTTAYPHRTANPVHGLSGWLTSGWPHSAPPALEGR